MILRVLRHWLQCPSQAGIALLFHLFLLFMPSTPSLIFGLVNISIIKSRVLKPPAITVHLSVLSGLL